MATISAPARRHPHEPRHRPQDNARRTGGAVVPAHAWVASRGRRASAPSSPHEQGSILARPPAPAGLDVPLRAAGNPITGAILHVEAAGRGAGPAPVGSAASTRPRDPPRRPLPRGSVLKPFVSARILQLVESGSFTLDSKLPEVLPAAVVGRFPTARDVTLGMLLGHRSGLPSGTPLRSTRRPPPSAPDLEVLEFLDLAAAQPAMFRPGARYTYSNTNYAGRARHRARDRPHVAQRGERAGHPAARAPVHMAPGARPPVPRRPVRRRVTSSWAASCSRRATSTHLWPIRPADMRRHDHRRPRSLLRRIARGPALPPRRDDEGDAVVQACLGRARAGRLRPRAHSTSVPGGLETIDHLGGTGGYMAYVARLPRQHITMALALTGATDPSPVLLPVLQALATVRP